MHPHLMPDPKHTQLGGLVVKSLQTKLQRVSVKFEKRNDGPSHTRCGQVSYRQVQKSTHVCLPTPRGWVQTFETQLANPPNQNG